METSRRTESAIASALCLILLSLLSIPSAAAAADRWSNVERVIAFADVHGAYDDLTQLLRTVGVVDAELHWAAGTAHVVSTGDLMDRGPGSRKVLDLLMRLQTEAQSAGGMLHVALGNHEAMNLLGDLRYVTPAEFAAYEADEPANLREQARQDWVAKHGPGAAAEFDKKFPRGYFAKRAAFARDGQYGRWLLALPVAIIINDTLFMHGGPSAAVGGLSIEEINQRYRTALSGVVNLPDALDSSSRLDAADQNPLLSHDGPNWYRGAALCNEASETDVLKPLMDGLGVKRVVIGHTISRNLRVASRFDGTVVKLDTGMNRPVYNGHPAALVLDRADVRVMYAEGGQPAAVPGEPLFVASSSIDDAALVSILTSGSITVSGPRGAGALDVVLEQNGKRVPAVFAQSSADAIRKDLAAYQLDRALRLGLVPATVKRAVNGQAGILQARPDRWVTQADVEQKSLRPGGWCALEPQFRLMYAFDALIGNEGRTRERILYDAAEWMLLLTGHEQAFGTSKALPRHLRAAVPQPGPEMRRRLAMLDNAALKQTLGDLLDDRERSALLARRDVLLSLKR
jgi:Calcineurin-like phosphoesterase